MEEAQSVPWVLAHLASLQVELGVHDVAETEAGAATSQCLDADIQRRHAQLAARTRAVDLLISQLQEQREGAIKQDQEPRQYSCYRSRDK